MAKPVELELITGKIDKIELTTAPAPAARAAKGRAQLTPKTVNRMSVAFRADDGGKEQDFTFTNCSVGLRPGDRIAIARALVKGRSAPILLGVFNEATGQQEHYPQGFAAAIARKAMIGPRGMAWIVSFAVFVLGYFLSRYVLSPEQGQGWWIVWPLLLAIMAYPLTRFGSALWERFGKPRDAETEMQRLHGEMMARVAANQRARGT